MSKTLLREEIQFGHYTLVLVEEDSTPTWLLKGGDSIMICRMWNPDPSAHEWYLWIGCDRIDISWCGAYHENDPQVAADEMWKWVENIAAMYCGEDGWL